VFLASGVRAIFRRVDCRIQDFGNHERPCRAPLKLDAVLRLKLYISEPFEFATKCIGHRMVDGPRATSFRVGIL
jgi:hypothetical protein